MLSCSMSVLLTKGCVGAVNVTSPVVALAAEMVGRQVLPASSERKTPPCWVEAYRRLLDAGSATTFHNEVNAPKPALLCLKVLPPSPETRSPLLCVAANRWLRFVGSIASARTITSPVPSGRHVLES